MKLIQRRSSVVRGLKGKKVSVYRFDVIPRISYLNEDLEQRAFGGKRRSSQFQRQNLIRYWIIVAKCAIVLPEKDEFGFELAYTIG